MRYLLLFLCISITNIPPPNSPWQRNLGISGNAVETVSGMDINNQGTIAAGPASTLRVQGCRPSACVPMALHSKTSWWNNTTLTCWTIARCSVWFSRAGGRVILGNNDLVLGPTLRSAMAPTLFSIMPAEMAKQNLAPSFPVGNNANGYNPPLAKTGPPTGSACAAQQAPMAIPERLWLRYGQYSLGSEEANAGGSSLAATAQWSARMNCLDFRTDCGIARYNTGTDWGFAAGRLCCRSDPFPLARPLTPVF
ncbi:MAG: hypothetical protein IPM98_06300 [Lewinellaceae bacterium]|nr:hypothetical protein [Lewinellaceae bacterium]